MATDSANDNPYAAPVAQNISAEERLVVNVKGLRIRWCVLVAVNVPVPIFFGITTTGGIGQIGMAIGIAAVAGVGLPLCARFPATMTNLCRGAVMTAFSQFYPIMQIGIGMMAVGICQAIPGTSNTGRVLQGIFPVTLATLITGVGLIIPSLIAGTVVSAIFSRFSPKARRHGQAEQQRSDGPNTQF